MLLDSNGGYERSGVDDGYVDVHGSKDIVIW
jgi:hypothetical protein